MQLSPRAGAALSPGGPHILDSRMQVSVGDTKSSCGNDILATLGGCSKPAMLELNTPSLGSSLQNQILGSLHPESAGITACYLDGSTNTQQRFDLPDSMYVEADRSDMQRAGGLMTFEQQETLQEVCSDSTTRLAYGNTNDASWRGRRNRGRNFLTVEKPHTAGDEWQSRVSSGFVVDSGPGRMAEDVLIEEQWGEKSFMIDRNAALAGDSWGQKRVKSHQRFRYGSPSHEEEGSSRASIWKSLLQIPVSMGEDYGGFGLVQENKKEEDVQYALQGSTQLSDLHSGSNFLGNRHAQRQRESRTPPPIVPDKLAEHISQGPKREREVNLSQMAPAFDFDASENAADITMMTGARQNEPQTYLSSSRNFHSVFPEEKSWQEAGCVSDYLLLTSAIHKAQLLDLQIQENQQHMKQESGGKRSHEKYKFTQGGNFSDHYEKSILSGLPAGLTDSRPDEGHSSLGDLLHGQDYLSDDMVLDPRHGEHLSAREAYEKARHDQHDDLSGKRIFKRSSKGGPRRPNIIKGQWTPEEDRFSSYTQILIYFL